MNPLLCHLIRSGMQHLDIATVRPPAEGSELQRTIAQWLLDCGVSLALDLRDLYQFPAFRGINQAVLSSRSLQAISGPGPCGCVLTVPRTMDRGPIQRPPGTGGTQRAGGRRYPVCIGRCVPVHGDSPLQLPRVLGLDHGQSRHGAPVAARVTSTDQRGAMRAAGACTGERRARYLTVPLPWLCDPKPYVSHWIPNISLSHMPKAVHWGLEVEHTYAAECVTALLRSHPGRPPGARWPSRA